MKKQNKNIHNDDLPKEFEDFLTNSQVSYSKNKSAVWEELEPELTAENGKTKVVKLNSMRYLVAASILLIGIVGFTARFYTKTIYSAAGQNITAILPDGSRVQLNAMSEINYKPFWWRFNRQVKLNGEAFFSVQKGEQFNVESKHGTTSVLGTSFNIYARGNEYEVTCITGKVKVVSTESDLSKIIAPNEKAVLLKSGSISVQSDIDTRESMAWTTNELFLNGKLDKIIRELERQYNVTIKTTIEAGTFNINLSSPKEENIELILERICPVNGLVFQKTAKNEYLIKKE